MKRVITKVGGIYEVRLDENIKKYFQYITNDRTQLNSDVIRGQFTCDDARVKLLRLYPSIHT
jgi:hypothetical protein